MKNRLLRDILHDLAMIGLIGAALDLALFAVLFAVFWLTTGRAALTALSYVRAALMIVGALALIICAGLLLFRKGTGLRNNQQWTKHFHRCGLFPVAFGVALFLLALAIVLDYLLFVPPSPASSIAAGALSAAALSVRLI